MTGKKGYFISIGGGENQLPLIRAVKDSGYRLIIADRNPKAPGFKEADIKIMESVTEYRRIYNYILKTLLDAPIVGIGCRSFGRASVSAAYLADKLRLNGNTVNSVKFFQNKFQYKKYLQTKGIPVP
ncbi:MAG TPA: biotin carboxylase, partial [Leptospiraceae bacterium]|nr:biotin carboxylase [Leptospiraceae bacterium]